MRCAFIFVIILGISGCKKNEFLGITPNWNISEPATLEEFQAILDNDIVMNGSIDRQAGVDPTFLLTGTDDYFVPDAILKGLNVAYQNMYKWSDDIYGLPVNNWDKIYKGVFYANVVLDGLRKYGELAKEKQSYDNIMGSALFFRSRFFFQLAQVYAPPYISATADQEMGVVLKLTSDINEDLKRSSLKNSYAQIIDDLVLSAKLLPHFSESPYKTRPCKAAAYGMLAKTYLVMGDFYKAKLYSDTCLSLQDTLLDYNSLSTSSPSNFPISRNKNPEIIFHSMINNNTNQVVNSFTARVDSFLYSKYDSKDLRRILFFRNTGGTEVFFKGSYDGGVGYFSGIAVDEIYLIRAEANIRLNDINSGLKDLNYLMINRWKNDGSFVPYITNVKEEALQFVLLERRKELLNRGIRWSDLRRLNVEGQNIIVKRNIGGEIYVLPPGDKRYTFLIPPDVISFSPGLPQNQR